jgi:hypothetical protein
MAKGKTVAIWIILVVVLAAAGGVIAIAVQNAKRQEQLQSIDDSAKNLNPKTVSSSSPAMNRAAGSGRPSMRMNTQQRGQGHRYNVAAVNAENQRANQLPPGYYNSEFNSGVGMTTFKSEPQSAAHLMSTTPMAMPSSGSGALFIPSKSPQAQMPAQQLFVSHNFPSTVETTLQPMSTSPMGTDQAVSVSTSPFLGSSYFQDPASMTPNTYADGLGLDAYMPNVSNATPDGLDPQTGLPVFSTASLRRSNELSSRGLQGFLRPTIDDTQGYKHTIGRRPCMCRYNDEGLQKKRNQFNAARVGGAEPTLFMETDAMYFP